MGEWFFGGYGGGVFCPTLFVYSREVTVICDKSHSASSFFGGRVPDTRQAALPSATARRRQARESSPKESPIRNPATAESPAPMVERGEIVGAAA